LSQCNGGTLEGEWDFRGWFMLSRFYGIRNDDHSLVRRTRDARAYPIAPDVIPIASDIGDNLICMAVKGKQLGSLWYWDHEEGPEVRREMPRIAPSFAAFLKGLERTGQPRDRELDAFLDRDDVKSMRRLLEEMTPADLARDLPNGSTLLEEAVTRGAGRIVKLLLEEKAPGRHAIGAAISGRQPAMLKLLLEHGYKPDKYSIVGCIYQDDPRCLKVLLDHLPQIPRSWFASAHPEASDLPNARRLQRMIEAAKAR
jgi:hypothetical protein